MANINRLLFVVSQLSTGGAERVISILANNFALRGHEVHLVTFLDVPDAYILDSRIIHRRIPQCEGNRAIQHLMRMKWIREYIRKNCIDAYITFEHYYGWTCAFKNCENYITSMRNDPTHDKLSFVERILRKVNFENAKAVVFQTTEIKKYFSSRVQKHAYVIKNPLPNNIPYGDSTREKRIVAVSRLEQQKNIPMLLRALKIVAEIHPEFVLEIYGDGSERKKIEQLIKELDLEKNIRLKGFCNNVDEQIVNAYMYVCTSNYEGLSNALLESMAMGLAIVSTDSSGGGAREVIKDGVNGYLVPINDDAKLAERMITLLDNPAKAFPMGQKAIEIRDELSETVVCDEWEKIINQHDNK